MLISRLIKKIFFRHITPPPLPHLQHPISSNKCIGRLFQNQLWRWFAYSSGVLIPRLIEKPMRKKVAILTNCGIYKIFICINRIIIDHAPIGFSFDFFDFFRFFKGNVRIIYPMGRENETHYLKWTYLRKIGVKSHIIEEGAYNKNYPSYLRVFSKRSNHNRHLVRALSS